MGLRAGILVAGAINTDLVATMRRAPEPGETVTGMSFAIHGGGKGANQSVAIARSGGEAALVGGIGNDDFGRARLTDLDRDGIDTRWVSVDDRASSGIALILVEDSGENRIAHVPGATNLVGAEHVLAAFDAIHPAFVLATNELPAIALVALFNAARAADVPVVFNATPEPALAASLLQHVAVLVANETEAAMLLGESAAFEPERAVSRLMHLGPRTVVLTLGANGACAGGSEGIAWYRPPRVAPIDTTGAGDTFCGAFVTELARGTRLDAAIRFGIHASALSVTRPGAQSSIPTRGEVEALLAGQE